MSNQLHESTNIAEDAADADRNDQEATELHIYEQSAIRNAVSVTTAADDDLYSVRTNKLKRQKPLTALESISAFWKRHVSVTVSHEDCRDHLGWCFDFFAVSVHDKSFQSSAFHLRF